MLEKDRQNFVISSLRVGNDREQGLAMTNLDVMTKILSETTGHTVGYWDHTLKASLAAKDIDLATQTQLLTPITDAEGEKLLQSLRKEKAGIFGWLVSGAVKSQGMAPNEKSKLGMFLSNQQN